MQYRIEEINSSQTTSKKLLYVTDTYSISELPALEDTSSSDSDISSV